MRVATGARGACSTRQASRCFYAHRGRGGPPSSPRLVAWPSLKCKPARGGGGLLFESKRKAREATTANQCYGQQRPLLVLREHQRTGRAAELERCACAGGNGPLESGVSRFLETSHVGRIPQNASSHPSTPRVRRMTGALRGVYLYVVVRIQGGDRARRRWAPVSAARELTHI